MRSNQEEIASPYGNGGVEKLDRNESAGIHFEDSHRHDHAGIHRPPVLPDMAEPIVYGRHPLGNTTLTVTRSRHERRREQRSPRHRDQANNRRQRHQRRGATMPPSPSRRCCDNLISIAFLGHETPELNNQRRDRHEQPDFSSREGVPKICQCLNERQASPKVQRHPTDHKSKAKLHLEARQSQHRRKYNQNLRNGRHHPLSNFLQITPASSSNAFVCAVNL